MLSQRILPTLQLHRGEGRTVALLVAIAFLLQAGMMIAQSATDALFFARYGVEKLPLLYGLVGAAMFATTLGITALYTRIGRARAFLLIPILIFAAALGSRGALEASASWIYGALWLVRNVAEFTQIFAVWGLAGLVADTRQAKRYFPLIAAGGVMGLIIGGVGTAPPATMLGSANLLLVWAALVAGATALAVQLVRTAGISLASSRRRRRRHGSDLMAGLADAVRPGLLRWMSAAELLIAVLFSLLYLAFSKVAVERYPDPDELAGFFGLFFAIALATAFVISLLVTSRLLARFGVPTVVLVLPILYVLAFGVFAVAATFATFVLFRFAQIAWNSGTANSTWAALINTIPSDRRDRARAFLYGVPFQLGTIIAGLVAFIAQRTGHPGILYGGGLVGALLAVGAIFGVRRAYPGALVAALREGRPAIFGAPRGPQPTVLHADAVSLAVLEGLLRDDDAAVRRLATHALGDFDREPAEAALLRVLEDQDASVRTEALESLGRRGASAAAVRAAAERLSDPDSAVRLAALSLCARAGTLPDKALLGDDDPTVRSQAAALLIPDDGEAREMLVGAIDRLRRFASEAVTRALEDTRLRDALGPPNGDALELLRNSLEARAERNALEALRAAALLGDRGAVSAAIENVTLSDAAQRANALEVIETVGEPAIVRPLLVLWEPSKVGERDARVIEQLRKDDDPWIRACAEFASIELEGAFMTRTETTVPLVERVVFLRKAPLFAALPPQDLQPIAELAEEHLFAEGDLIAAEGELGDTTYVILDGEVDVVAGGRMLAVRGTGDVIGEMSVISSRPRVASLRAKSNVRVLEIHKPAFEAILRERPDTALALMRVLCERLAPYDPALN